MGRAPVFLKSDSRGSSIYSLSLGVLGLLLSIGPVVAGDYLGLLFLPLAGFLIAYGGWGVARPDRILIDTDGIHVWRKWESGVYLWEDCSDFRISPYGGKDMVVFREDRARTGLGVLPPGWVAMTRANRGISELPGVPCMVIIREIRTYLGQPVGWE